MSRVVKLLWSTDRVAMSNQKQNGKVNFGKCFYSAPMNSTSTVNILGQTYAKWSGLIYFR